MSKGISVGDLVMVVKPRPCGCLGAIGKIFKVDSISVKPFFCDICQDWKHNQIVALDSNGFSCTMPRLTKIDPPDLPEEIETKEELIA